MDSVATVNDHAAPHLQNGAAPDTKLVIRRISVAASFYLRDDLAERTE